MSPEPAGTVATAEPEPATPFDEPPPAQTAAQPVQAAPPPVPKRNPSFFERANAIPKADWGTRAFIYVYCLEPICNLKMGGESKYLVRLQEPIADEQALMIDYGSGKYRLQLVNRKAGGDKSDAIDTKEIEIYNPKYPPKIPRNVWMNDPRNERWAALLPKEQPPQPPTGLGTLTDAFKTFSDMRKDIRDELAPAAPAGGAPTSDPMGNALSMVQTIMAMKADNPMVEIMKLQLQTVSDQAERARQREADLQKELRDMVMKLSERKSTEPERRSGLKEALAEVKEFLPAVKELLPGLGNAAEIVRGGRTNGWDIVRDTVTTIGPTLIDYGGKIALALLARQPGPPQPMNGMGAPAQALPAPQANGQPAAPPPNAQQPQQNIPKFVHFLAQPLAFDAFRRYFEGFKKQDGQTGADFAQWVFDGGGVEHMKDARAMGSANIMALLKQSPAWMLFQADEAKLSQFVDDALAWAPPAADSEEDDEEEDDDSVDLTAATAKGL